MATSREQQQKQKDRKAIRNEQIKKDFTKLTNKKRNGVKLYTQAVILAQLGDKYFLSPKTIEDIVFNRTKSK